MITIVILIVIVAAFGALAWLTQGRRPGYGPPVEPEPEWAP